MDRNNNRIEWIESLKLLAALLVFTTHFLAEFNRDWLNPWKQGNILYGLSGKLAVSFFFFTAGYFAMKAKKADTWQYITKRYFRFALPVLLIEMIMFFMMLIFKALEIDTKIPINMTQRYISLNNISYNMFLSDIFLLDGKVVLTYWCNIMLFQGPVIVTLLHGLYDSVKTESRVTPRAKIIIFFIIPALIAVMTGYVWYSICMMGAILYLILQKERCFFQRTEIKVMLTIILYFCIRTSETTIGCTCKGVASACLFLIVFHSKWLQKLLENKICHVFSHYSFEIYLLHTPVNLMIISFIFGFGENIGINQSLLVITTYFFSLTLTVTLSIGLHKISTKIITIIFNKIDYKY